MIASEFEDLVVGIPGEDSDAQLTYQTLSGQPVRKMVWQIEADTYDTGGYALKNLARPGYYLTAVGGDTGAWNLVARASEKNTANTCYQFTFSNEDLLIQTNSAVNSDNADRYWGDWTVGTHANGDKLAGNKQSADKVTFKLYKKDITTATDVSFLIGNADFSGSYSGVTATPTAVDSDRKIYQPEGWNISMSSKNQYNMTVVKPGDPQQTAQFTGDYVPTDGKYMVRFRNDRTDEYIDLNQNITIKYAGLYLLSADLISQDCSKLKVELYAGTQKVTNSKNGTWQTRYLLLNVSANQTITIGVKFTNNNGGDKRGGADNIKLEKLADAPVDVTRLVTNATFDDGINGWTSMLNAYSNTVKASDNTKPGTTNFWENWNGSAKQGRMFQTISSLPQGTYKLKVMAFADQLGTMTPINTDVAVYAKGDGEIHRNYVNSTSFTDYYTWAYVGSGGTLEIGLRQDITTFGWLGMDNVTLEYVGSDNQEDALLAAELNTKWTTVKTYCSPILSDDDYTCVSGSERTTLSSAVNSTVSSISDYTDYIASYNAFIAAKPNYDKFDVEKTNALLMGVDENDVVRPASGSDADLLTAMRGLYELEGAASDNYAIDATTIFGSWVEQNTSSASGEHWSGDGRRYIDRSQNTGYTMSVTNTVTLPAGRYVFKAAARAAADGVNGAFNMSVKIGNNAAVYKHYNAQGNTGKGIDTSGAANYGEGTFANDGAGRGWEWRFFGFDLDEETSVQMRIYAQILANKWVSFSDITLLTTSDNIAICEQLWTTAKAAAIAARDNGIYTAITGKERADLIAAITAAGTEPTTSAGYKEQETALLEATSAFIAAKETYDEYAGQTPIATALDVSVPAITSSTTAATLVENMQTINVAEYAAVTGVSTDYTYNATSLLGAWSNAPGTNKGQSWDGSDNDTYYDLYNSSARAMSQTVILPKAHYVLMAKGRASTDGRLTLSNGANTITFPHKGNDGKGIETDGSANFGEGTYSNSGNGNGWEYRFLTFESDGSTSTTLTFSWTTASSNWAGLDDITLLAIPETVTIAEDADENPDNSIANVTLARSFRAGWNAVCLPFATDAFDDAEIAEFTGETADGDNVTLNFTKVDAFEANKPYLVYFPSAVAADKTFNGVLVNPTDVETTGTAFDFKGTYIVADVAEGDWVISGGALKKAAQAISLKPTRTYFTPKAAGARIAGFTVDGDDTAGIVAINRDGKTEIATDAYNLNGQKMAGQLKKGIYIVNGKKTVVK